MPVAFTLFRVFNYKPAERVSGLFTLIIGVKTNADIFQPLPSIVESGDKDKQFLRLERALASVFFEICSIAAA